MPFTIEERKGSLNQRVSEESPPEKTDPETGVEIRNLQNYAKKPDLNILRAT